VCFRADVDYLVYLVLLKERAEKFGCAIHAYVLMTNHVHMLLTSDHADGASLMMKHLGQCYVQYFNRKYGRTGTLWEGRFRSSIVQEREYLIACYRYIELNPVRAGMVEHPRDYRWSSYGCNAEARPSALISPHPVYLALGEREQRFAAYRTLFNSALTDVELKGIRAATNGGYAIGDDAFKTQLAERAGRRVDRRQPGRPKTKGGRPETGSVPDFELDLKQGLSPI
jgi:putative transposase